MSDKLDKAAQVVKAAFPGTEDTEDDEETLEARHEVFHLNGGKVYDEETYEYHNDCKWCVKEMMEYQELLCKEKGHRFQEGKCVYCGVSYGN